MTRKIQKFYFEDLFKKENADGHLSLFTDFIYGYSNKVLYFQNSLKNEELEKTKEKMKIINVHFRKMEFYYSIELYSETKISSFSRLVQYNFPFINSKQISFNQHGNLLKSFKWDKIESGFLIIDEKGFTFVENIEGNFEDFFTYYFKNYVAPELRELAIKRRGYRQVYFSENFDYGSYDEAPKKNKRQIRRQEISNNISDRKSEEYRIANRVDKETLTKIVKIQDTLEELRKNPNFYLIAPIISQILTEKSSLSIISRLKITKDFDIILTDYNNTKIHLSHLTKSIYFLLLKHPEGIARKDYKNHKEELLEIYKAISYQNSYTKITNTIEKLFERRSNDLSVHFSRIKSAFCKQFTHSLAINYFVSINEGEPTSIILDRSLVEWEMEI